MPTFSLRPLNLSATRNNKASNGGIHNISAAVDESCFVIPLPLSMSTSTLSTVTSESRSAAADTTDYAQMLDDDNLAWGSSRPPKSKKTSRSKKL